MTKPTERKLIICQFISLFQVEAAPANAAARDALGRTPLICACSLASAAEVVGILVRSHPAAAAHQVPRSTLRMAFDDDNSDLIVAFRPAAAVVFEEYAMWTETKGKEVSFEFSIDRRRPNDFLATEPIVRLLLRAGSDPEWLLAEAAKAPTTKFARVLLRRGLATGLEQLGEGRGTARDVGLVSPLAEMSALFRPLGAFLGRYKLDAGPRVHTSETCTVVFARDLKVHRPIALKLMRHRRQFTLELLARRLKDGRTFDDLSVVSVIAAHTPRSEASEIAAEAGLQPEPEPTDGEDSGWSWEEEEAAGTYPYVLVLPQGQRSLHGALCAERIAGVDVERTVSIVRNVAGALQEMHGHGVLHGDVKPRNILRVGLGERRFAWSLVDLDASARLGDLCGTKSSTGYLAPELARRRFLAHPAGRLPPDAPGLLEARPSLDAWSLGVVLFELCAGRTLWMLSLAEDSIVGAPHGLLGWGGVSDAQLAEVFSSPEAAARHTGGVAAFSRDRACAQHLVRWLLHPEPERRPSMAEVLAHPLFDPAAPAPAPLPELYFGFLSHMQAQAAADAGAIYSLLARSGFNCWWDMRQPRLTLEGMMAGVQSSRVFILLLTRDVLTRPFCQKEILCAISEGKQILLLVEVDSRFFPFDRFAFEAAAAAVQAHAEGSADFPTKPLFDTESEEDYIAIITAVSSALSEAMPIRRRDHEADAMSLQMARLAGFHLPSPAVPATGLGAGAALSVHIISAEPSPGSQPDVAVAIAAIKRDVEAALAVAGDGVVLVPTAAGADRVLVILTAASLAPSSVALAELESVLAGDAVLGKDRILMVHLPLDSGLPNEAAFDFNGADAQAAPEHVKRALWNHESLAFRCRGGGHSSSAEKGRATSQHHNARDSGIGPSPHSGGYEWCAMARHLVKLLGRDMEEALQPTGTAPSEPVGDLRTRLEASERRLLAWEAEKMAEVEAVHAADRAKIAAQEHGAARLQMSHDIESAVAQARAEARAEAAAEMDVAIAEARASALADAAAEKDAAFAKAVAEAVAKVSLEAAAVADALSVTAAPNSEMNEMLVQARDEAQAEAAAEIGVALAKVKAMLASVKEISPRLGQEVPNGSTAQTGSNLRVGKLPDGAEYSTM